MKKVLYFLLGLSILFISINLYLKTDHMQKNIEEKLEKILKHQIAFSSMDFSLKGILIHDLIVYKDDKEILFKAKKVYFKNQSHFEITAKFNSYDIYIVSDYSSLKKQFDIQKLTISDENIRAVSTNVGKLELLEKNNFALDIDLLVKCKEIHRYLTNFNGPVSTTLNLKMQGMNNIFLTGNADLTRTKIIYKKLTKKFGVNCNLDYKVFFNQEPFKITVESAVLHIFNNEKINMTGYFSKGNYDFNLQANGVAVNNINSIFRDKSVRLKKGKIDFDAFFSPQKKSLVLVLDFLDVTFSSNTFTNLNGIISYDNADINVQKLSGSVNGSKFKFSTNKDNYLLDLDFLDANNFSAYSLFFYPLTSKKTVRGNLKFGQINYKTLNFQNLKTNLLLEHEFVYLNDLTGKFQGGDFDAKIKFDLPRQIYDAQFGLKNIELDGICKVFDLKFNVTGKTDGTINVRSKLIKPKIEDFLVTADLLANNGEFQDIKIFNAFAKKFNKKDLSILHYEMTLLKAKLDGGIFDIAKFKTKTKELGIADIDGKINFVDKSLDLDLNFDVNKQNSLVKRLGIQGPFKKPQYQIVLSDVIKNLGENILGFVPNLITKKEEK